MLDDRKSVVSSLLTELEKRREKNLPPEEAERLERERAAQKRRDEYEIAEAENRRILWLNEFYQKTDRHGLPFSADTAKLDLLDESGPDAESMQFIKAWRPSDPFGLMLIGPAGCGKSYALQAIAKSIMFDYREFSEYRQSLRWFPVTRSLDQIRNEMSTNSDAKKASALSATYLFVDDLGAENLTEWSREQIYQIIETRLNFARTTFISSNCTLEELKSRYHERFVSRLKEMFIFLSLKGKDRRGETMKSNLQTLKDRISKSKESEGA